MKTLLRLLPFLALVLVSLRAAEDPVIAAVRAADDERVAAMKSADRARLEAIFSDGLRYAHSSGKVDTKTSYIESIVHHTSVYETYDYSARNFVPAGPGVVLMNGRVLIQSRSGGQQTLLDLNFLAVWRQENGQWHFFAWQSCKNPPPGPAAAK
jgi:hypothetical protein